MIGAFLIFRRIGKCSQAYRASKLPLHQRELKIAAPELQSGHCDLPVIPEISVVHHRHAIPLIVLPLSPVTWDLETKANRAKKLTTPGIQ